MPPITDGARGDVSAERELTDALVARDAALWRDLMAPKEGLRTGAEALRRTARGAVEDWLEVRAGEAPSDPEAGL